MGDIVETGEKTAGVENVPGLQHHIFDICGGTMSVYEAGQKDRPVVVMLHGAMFDQARFSWDQLFPFLSRYYHLFAPDIPRHGKSRPWTGNLSHARLVDILQKTFRRLELDYFSLVGLSMGGALSIEYASLHPRQVKSLILFEPGGLGDKINLQFAIWLYTKIPFMLQLLSKKYAKMDQAALKRLLESLYVGGSKPTDPDRLVSILQDEIKGKRKYGERDLDDWQLNLIGPFRLRWHLLDRIPLLQCPTLWLRGAESVLVKQWEMERAVKLAIRNGVKATLKVIPQAGHLLPLERPLEANTAVKKFLIQAETGTRGQVPCPNPPH